MRLKIRRTQKAIVIITLLLSITVGFAYLNTEINIKGAYSVQGGTWDVHFKSLSVRSGSKTPEVPATINESTDLSISFAVSFENSDEFYEFSVDVKNAGTINAKLSEITKTGYTEEAQKYLIYLVMYADGENISEGDTLAPNQTEKLRVRVQYRNDISTEDAITEDKTIGLGIRLKYVQADSLIERQESNKKVILSDGSEWYLLNTEFKNNTVRLFSAYNLGIENEKYVQSIEETNYKPMFDYSRTEELNPYCNDINSGCNAYDVGTDVSEESKMKIKIGEIRNQFLNDGVINSQTNVDLITLDDLENIGCNSKARLTEGNCTYAPSWIYTPSYYWTRTAKSNKNSWDVWALYNKTLTYDKASRDNAYAIRPVLETSYDNLKALTQAHSLTTENERTIAVWMNHADVLDALSSQQAITKAISKLTSNTINTIYMRIIPENIGKYTKLIKAANESNIKVYALYDDPNVILEEDYKKGIDELSNYISIFNAINKNQAYIEGIHYDIDYQNVLVNGEKCTSGETSTKINCPARKKYIDFIRAARQKTTSAGLEVQQGVSLWNTQFATFYDDDTTQKVIIDEVIQNSDSVVLLTYGKEKQETIEPIIYTGNYSHENGGSIQITKSYLEKAMENNKELIVGQELLTFKQAAEETITNPTYVPGYGESYEYTRTFVRTIINDVKEDLDARLPTGKKTSFAIQDYRDILKLDR